MLPVAALPAGGCRQLSFNATSPIKDAAEGTLYTDRPALLKVRLWKVADRMLRDPAAAWDCPCPFCLAFSAAHPFDLDRARSLVRGRTRPLVAGDLRAGTDLGRALPLFALGAGPGRAAEQVRVGHNHWILGSLTGALPAGRLCWTASSRPAWRATRRTPGRRTSPRRSAWRLALELARSGEVLPDTG